MSGLYRVLGGGLIAFSSVFVAPAAAPAMTLKECSGLYQAAKKNGTLNGQDWRAFRASQCPAGPAEPDPQGQGAEAEKAADAAAKPAPPANTASSSSPEFPAVIDPRYAAEKPARARLHTCADAYHRAKKAGTLNGLRWIEKGGGFYSRCNRGLKGKA